MKKILFLLAMMVIPCGFATMADATPTGLHNNLDGTITDHDTNLMWLQDANAGAGSTFDNGFSSTDGRMTWQNANDWAASLTVGGFTGWRLPTTTQPDPTCGSQTGDTPPQDFGFGCTGGEMGHLFNSEGITAALPGPFTNIQPNFYWSGTEFAPVPAVAWDFFFLNGSQGADFKATNRFAWAVRPGDVSAVPEPSMLVLLGSGLVGLIGFGWKNRRLRR